MAKRPTILVGDRFIFPFSSSINSEKIRIILKLDLISTQRFLLLYKLLEEPYNNVSGQFNG